MKTKIFINGELIDLFGDETITVTSKLADIENLSNVFNDYSNSFTIPATPNNNRILNHYYDYSINNTFNANIRISAYIEVETLPFKFGVMQLEGVILTDFRPSSYKITFFGGLTQLSDLFGDDVIGRLDYKSDEFGNETKQFTTLSQLDYDYTGPNFSDSINNPSFKDGNVITPLISYAKRDWNYGSGDNSDISTDNGAILDTELRPAIRIMKLLEGIETKYDLSFSRDFFGSSVFNNLFMWTDPSLKGFGEYRVLDLEATTYELADASSNGFIINNTNDTIQYTSTGGNRSIKVYIQPNTGYYDVSYKIGIYDNGVEVFESQEYKGINDIDYTASGSHNLTYKIKADATFQYYYVFILFAPDWTNYIQINNQPSIYGIWNVCLGGVNFTDTLPKLKVIDFFQGIMKMFKLVIRPIDDKTFYVDTLNGYYSNGNILDISEYVDNKTVVIDRPLIYKTLKFLYQKTDNVLGKNFRETNDPSKDEVGYGDLRSIYQTIQNKEELKIELPFENMLFERLIKSITLGDDITTNIIIGQSNTLENSVLSPNNSKPILFFNNGLATNTSYPFKIRFGGVVDEDGPGYGTGGTLLSNSYSYIIGNTNDAILNQVTDTINFGSEIDPWHLSQVNNSLYLNYWKNWIETVYSLKQRKFRYNAILPTRYIKELSLNDRIVIGNNRFKISDYSINISTGETVLNLFNDIFEYQPEQPVVSITNISFNAGSKYHSINVNTTKSWVVQKLDEGFGVDWIEVITPNGIGSSEIVIRVLEKATQTPPEVYENRVMTLYIIVDGIYYEILVTQYGLTAP